MFKLTIAVITLFFSVSTANATGKEAHVAVASNLAPTLEKLSQAFYKSTNYKTVIAKGSTGTLYTIVSS